MPNAWLVRVLGVFLLAMLYGSLLAATSSAQPGWRVEPGAGYGPVRLGMTPDEVLASLGAPSNRREPGGTFLELGYRTSFYRFQAQRLVHIIIWDRTATTRGGVRVGSTLSQVVDVFGDSYGANLQSSPGGQARNCLGFTVEQLPGPNRLRLTANYRHLGISFAFVLTDDSTRPTVAEITVETPRACQPGF